LIENHISNYEEEYGNARIENEEEDKVEIGISEINADGLLTLLFN